MSVSQKLRLWRGKVLPEWIDYNGHMNEGFYGVVFGLASDEYLIRLGFGEDYRTRGGSFYTVETHIVFVDELAEGTPLVVDTVVAGADQKRLLLFHELRNANTEALSATQEATMLHVDTVADKVSPMSAALYDVLATDAAAHAGVLPEGTLHRSTRPIPP